MKVKTYRDLIAWQRSMELVRSVYEATRRWPSDEQYGLTSQVRRAAVSIPSNIAEGFGRRATKDYLRHLGFAYGSLLEAETQLQIASMLGYLPSQARDGLLAQCTECGKILNGLITSLRSRPA